VKKHLTLFASLLWISACAGPRITPVMPLAESADAPYGNILVVSLFESFDNRRFFEDELVKALAKRGVNAVASTSRMNTRTPVNRDTFVAMVEELGSDAVLLTQLTDLDTESKVREMRPEATYNVRPTWYYNIWSVELTEYREPENVEFRSTVGLSAQVFSAQTRTPVWAIETASSIKQDFDRPTGYKKVIGLADAIAQRLRSDGLLAR
jgi:hypothetical protein